MRNLPRVVGSPLIDPGSITLDELRTRLAEAEAERDRLRTLLSVATAPDDPRGATTLPIEANGGAVEFLTRAAADLLASRNTTAVEAGLYGRLAQLVGLDGYVRYGSADAATAHREPTSWAGIDAAGAQAIPLQHLTEQGSTAALEPLVIEGIEHSRDPALRNAQRLGITAYAAFPLHGRKSVSGTLCFFRRSGRRFTAGELEILGAACQLVGAAVERNRADAAVLRSEERLRQILGHIPAGVIIADANGALIYGNPEVERIMQAPFIRSRDIAGWATWPLYLPDRDEAFPLDQLPVIRTVRTGEAVIGEEMRIRRPDGTFRTVVVNSAPIHDIDGYPAFTVAVFIDVSEQKRIQAELQETRDLLRMATGASRLGWGTWDFATGTAEVDERGREILGLNPRGPITIDDWLERIHPDDRKRVRWELRRSVIERRAFESEYRVLLPSGELRHIHRTGTFDVPENDGPVRGTGLIRDITEQKRAEEALQKSEANFRAIADLVPDLLWQSDAEGRSIWYNRRWLEYTGQTLDAALGNGWTEAMHPADRAVSVEAFREAVGHGEPLRIELRFRGVDGEYRWFLVQVRPVRSENGEIRQWFGAASDVHEQRVALEAERLARAEADRARGEADAARQAAEKASEAKGQFLAVMSHELRTPLTGVIAYGELLETGIFGPVNEKQHEALVRIQANSWHLVSIIEEILNLSRAEAGKVEVQLDTFDLAGVAREVVGMLESESNLRGLAMGTENLEGRIEIHSDAGKVRQILLNLVGNAVKYTERGQVQVWLDTSEAEWLSVRVRDTGPGIAAEDQERIFEPFTQVDNSYTRTRSGTGLGLAICRRLAQLLGGDVTLISTPGEGSTFSLRLPR